MRTLGQASLAMLWLISHGTHLQVGIIWVGSGGGVWLLKWSFSWHNRFWISCIIHNPASLTAVWMWWCKWALFIQQHLKGWKTCMHDSQSLRSQSLYMETIQGLTKFIIQARTMNGLLKFGCIYYIIVSAHGSGSYWYHWSIVDH